MVLLYSSKKKVYFFHKYIQANSYFAILPMVFNYSTKTIFL